jgi:hypothetical protein
MQQELDALELPVAVIIHGINQAGHEGSNEAACQGKDIPWLQEVPQQPVWTTWAVTYRDVIILNESNEVVGSYNLTDHNLSNAADYDALKNKFIKIAGGS